MLFSNRQTNYILNIFILLELKIAQNHKEVTRR
jgi:hypothetical protein